MIMGPPSSQQWLAYDDDVGDGNDVASADDDDDADSEAKGDDRT